jgi:hypothetical protein
MSRPPLRTAGSRPSRTAARTARPGTGAVSLESMAAEFALLTQRQARIARQLALLGRQHAAAVATQRGVEARMAILARRMGLATGSASTAVPLAPNPSGPDAPAAAPAPRPAGRRRGLLLEY